MIGFKIMSYIITSKQLKYNYFIEVYFKGHHMAKIKEIGQYHLLALILKSCMIARYSIDQIVDNRRVETLINRCCIKNINNILFSINVKLFENYELSTGRWHIFFL